MDNRKHYSRCAIELLENSVEKAEVEGSIVKVADTGYDKHEIFKHLADRGIKPVVKVKVVITGNRARDGVIMAIR